jgi:hypothetical protein
LKLYQTNTQRGRCGGSQPALLLRQVGGFDAVAGLQFLDGLGQLVADRAFGQMHPDRHRRLGGVRDVDERPHSAAVADQRELAAWATTSMAPARPSSAARAPRVVILVQMRGAGCGRGDQPLLSSWSDRQERGFVWRPGSWCAMKRTFRWWSEVSRIVPRLTNRGRLPSCDLVRAVTTNVDDDDSCFE